MFDGGLGADVLHHTTTQCHRQRLDATTDAQHRDLTVVGQPRDQQLWQVTFLIDTMQLGRRFLSYPKGIDISSATEDQGIDTVEGIQNSIGISYRGNNQRYTSCSND